MAKTSASRKTKSKTSKSKMKSRKRAKLPARKSAKKKTKKVTKKPTQKVATSPVKPPAKKAAKIISKPAVKIVRASTPAIAVVQPAAPKLQVGAAAPDFTLNNHEGQPVSLSSYRGKKVVLYFYPKDDTPGCTKEACSFRDNIGFVDSSDAVILGVSFDDQASHQKFIEKYGLNFQLLSDTDKTVANDFGVYVQKNMYGNLSWGIERSTFVIDREGGIRSAFRKVSVDGHTEEVLEALRSID